MPSNHRNRTQAGNQEISFKAHEQLDRLIASEINEMNNLSDNLNEEYRRKTAVDE